MTKSKKTAAMLLKQLAEMIGTEQPPANEDAPTFDKEALRERAHRAAERMRRARNR